MATSKTYTQSHVGFWRSQFTGEPTVDQIVNDACIGILLPIGCVVLDPTVFRSSVDPPILGRYRLAAYAIIGVSTLSLAAWIGLRRASALFAGVLAGGALFAALLGLVLLPFSIVGMLFVIGILGFAPFATAFVFSRNAIRAYAQARRGQSGIRLVLPALLGLAITLGCPCTLQALVDARSATAKNLVLSKDPQRVEEAIAILRPWRSLVDIDWLVDAYDEERDPAQRQRLANAYERITGLSIEEARRAFRD
jgi:hypothetical protein